ncbi:MAG TPA: 50S ribosomal protein L10 [Acidimicrobiales bacterium]|nr:50S ribosomal protein L10 [Acidimicrobiales bacterium]
MDNPRADKVAVVNEVRGRLEASEGALLTEYRGLSVAELAELRRDLARAGGEYKIYKNTLVRLAVADSPQASIQDLLTGPTAIAFVDGDVSAVAKALRDFGRSNPSLVIKGGIVGDGLLSASEITVLADLPSRDVLLAQVAGAFAAPVQQLAGLIQALPRNLAYGLSALLAKREEEGPAASAEAAPADAADETPAAEAAADTPTAEAPAAEAPAAEAATQDTAAETPAAEAPAAEGATPVATADGASE